MDCYTHEPLVFVPGFVNSTIYSDQVEAGWTFGPYFVHSADFWRQGESLLNDRLQVFYGHSVVLAKAHAQVSAQGDLTVPSVQTLDCLSQDESAQP